MRQRISQVNPLGGKPVQLVCRTNFSYKIVTEEIIDSSINENGDNVICFLQDSSPVWINEKDNLIINVTHYNVNRNIVPSKLYPQKPVDPEFNKISGYNTTEKRSRNASETSSSIRLSKTTQVRLECLRAENIAFKFGTSLYEKQTSDYGKFVNKTIKNKTQNIKSYENNHTK